VSVPETVARALAALESDGLRITVDDSGPETGTGESRTARVIGQDHPGIVREISQAIARRGVNLQELATECLSTSWSGGTCSRPSPSFPSRGASRPRSFAASAGSDR
jgi:glycine cleavage system regulatory protein